MRNKPATMLATLSAALLSVAIAAPALADSEATAVGLVKWNSDSDGNLDRQSSFRVYDAAPGVRGDLTGDHGWYVLKKSNGGSMRMDVRCALIDVEAGFAEFSGRIVEATEPFNVGEVFLVSVKDGGRSGDEIGMKAGRGCPAALDGNELTREGNITGGFIKLRAPR